MKNTVYRTALTPWIVVHIHSLQKRTIVARFRNRNDADGHLAVLRRLMPEAELQIAFDRNSTDN
ncbi:hypothetical protein F7734_29000 [Scytonema sp. UIC 10036]|uniref:hypothetical protein n=1 Tax=Scytonema sp. UIC 10036 TaxID=2304196 RepID=UPI0012DA8EC8|nr:hypothetical protein [Scytonema sp. UIC 10036]MUG96162.1 hypothetical protein [Scytonema sp. UIC 10036]